MVMVVDLWLQKDIAAWIIFNLDLLTLTHSCI